ncbi:MAG TPA: type II toxin-antitoxin system Phd/YefM family antitoxin [Acidimicrobiales bacterium]|nr:type II toxin-antitoxin system Phd/YefM family antitoxin [Acidimicrobiales bacterium]
MPTREPTVADTASLTETRDNLSEILDEVCATGREFVITRHGRPVAVILAHDEHESMIETLNILSDRATMDALTEAESDASDGGIVEL